MSFRNGPAQADLSAKIDNLHKLMTTLATKADVTALTAAVSLIPKPATPEPEPAAENISCEIRMTNSANPDQVHVYHGKLDARQTRAAEMKWQDVRVNLLKRFQDPYEEADRLVALTARMQQPNESPEDYLKDKIELFYKAMPLGRVQTLIRFAELGLSLYADRDGRIVLGSDGKTVRYVQKSLKESWNATSK